MKWMITLVAIAVAGSSFAQDCCSKKEAKQEATTCGASAKKSGCGEMVSAEQEFMAEAHKMAMSADGKQACCKSTATKAMAKGDKGCCNAKGEMAKYKVYVAEAGYKYFGCEGSASKGRKELMAKGHKVGNVQKVNGKVAMK